MPIVMWCHERKTLRSTPRPFGVGAAVLVYSTISGWAAATESTAPILRISGKASFSTEARATTDGFELRATLNDEVGRPLPSAEVRVRTSSNFIGATLHRCGNARGEAGGELLVSTDEAGRLCVNVTGMASGTIELGFQDPRGYIQHTSRLVPLPESVASTFEVGFDPPLTALSLDQPVQEIGVVVRSSGSALPDAAELILSRDANGSERELSRIALESLGETQRLALVSASFGDPGPLRLIAKLLGRDGKELGRATTPVLCTATVALHVDDGARASVQPGSVLSVYAASTLGPAPLGVVEAKSRGLSVAAAPVKAGMASLVLPRTQSTSLGGSLTLEYVGASAGWLSGQPLELRISPPPPSYGRYAFWIAAAALAALAVVLGWRRPARPRSVSIAAAPRARGSVEVVETFGTAGGYRGLVRDAHEGTALSPAVVSFVDQGGLVLAQIRTSHDGTFEVTGAATFPAGTLIEVTAPHHATLRAPLPVPGVLELSLVSRRRALLERLVRWAERRGKPWTQGAADPTPAHLAQIAAAEGETRVRDWAERVELLAFGATPPDAASEHAAGVTEDPKLSRD